MFSLAMTKKAATSPLVWEVTALPFLVRTNVARVTARKDQKILESWILHRPAAEITTTSHSVQTLFSAGYGHITGTSSSILGARSTMNLPAHTLAIF